VSGSRWRLAAAIAVAIAVDGTAFGGTPNGAGAGTLTARLEFERGPGAELCPAPELVKRAVIGRLGLDPFTDDGVRRIRCTVNGDAGGLRARIEITDDPAQEPAERLLSSPRRDCNDLAEAIELALSIAINPMLALVPASAPVAAPVSAPAATSPTPAPVRAVGRTVPPTPQVAAVVAVASLSPATPPPLPVVRVRSAGRPTARVLSLRLDALAAAGVGPAPALGGGLGLSVRQRQLSLEIDARAIGPSGAAAGGGRVVTWVGMLSLAPCAHWSSFAGCAVGSVGGMWAEGEGFALSETSTVPYFAAGARLAWERSLGDRWWLRAALDASAVVGRARLLLSGRDAWVSPRVNAVLGLGAGVHFP
jgi:hypothetical protein